MATANSVPVYKLYGEHEQWPTPDMFHCELIADRSKLHDWQIKLHQHHGLVQLLCLKGGDARACLDGRYIDMQAGQVAMVPQMCVHGFRFEPNAVGHVVTLAAPMVKRLIEGMEGAATWPTSPRICEVQPNQKPQVDMAFQILQEEYLASRAHRNGLIESMLTSILIWLHRHLPAAANETPSEIDRGVQHFRAFSELIENHYTEQWPVSRYADQLGITAAHLNALCRRIVGQSALELIHQRVILAAKRNLVYTSMTISVVSYTLGFADPAYFTRYFKRQVGVSPKEFRRRAATLVE